MRLVTHFYCFADIVKNDLQIYLLLCGCRKSDTHVSIAGGVWEDSVRDGMLLPGVVTQSAGGAGESPRASRPRHHHPPVSPRYKPPDCIGHYCTSQVF